MPEFTADAELSDRDLALMQVLAHAAAVIIEPDVRHRHRTTGIQGRLGPLIEGGGPVVLLQPIVDLATGWRVGAEALRRFPSEWDQPPDECFADAGLIGQRANLEILALRRAAQHLPDVTGYIAMNISPATLFTPGGVDFLQAMPLQRIVLELSEHDPIEDYDALTAVLAPFRARGMRLAIDDVGAGFSSLRHIVATAPDVIKLDRSIVTGVAADPVLDVVVHALVDIADGIGAKIVAEGIETSGRRHRPGRPGRRPRPRPGMALRPSHHGDGPTRQVPGNADGINTHRPQQQPRPADSPDNSSSPTSTEASCTYPGPSN